MTYRSFRSKSKPLCAKWLRCFESDSAGKQVTLRIGPAGRRRPVVTCTRSAVFGFNGFNGRSNGTPVGGQVIHDTAAQPRFGD